MEIKEPIMKYHHIAECQNKVYTLLSCFNYTTMSWLLLLVMTSSLLPSKPVEPVEPVETQRTGWRLCTGFKLVPELSWWLQAPVRLKRQTHKDNVQL